MVYLLFFREHVPTHPQHYGWMDKLAGMGGFIPVVIDLIGDWPQDSYGPPVIFHSLENARASYKLQKCVWVWLTPSAKEALWDYKHPEDNVVYCIGRDRTGFSGFNIPEKDIQVNLGHSDELLASISAHHVVYDRMLYQLGKRI